MERLSKPFLYWFHMYSL